MYLIVMKDSFNCKYMTFRGGFTKNSRGLNQKELR